MRLKIIATVLTLGWAGAALAQTAVETREVKEVVVVKEEPKAPPFVFEMHGFVSGSLLVASVFGFGAILWETPRVVRTMELFFMMVGVLLMTGLSTIGTGAFLLSRAGTPPSDIGEPGPGGDPARVPLSRHRHPARGNGH